jgi:hypothetical protein
VAEQVPPRVGPGRSADECQRQQAGLGDAPRVRLGEDLVDPERRERREVDRYRVSGDVRGGESEGERVHGSGAGLRIALGRRS